MRLVRFETAASPTLDLGLLLRRAKSVAVRHPEPQHRHWQAFRAWTSQIRPGHGIQHVPACRTTNAHHFPHRIREGTAGRIALAGVHHGLKPVGCVYAHGDGLSIRESHQALNRGPARTRPKPETEGTIPALQAGGTKQERNEREGKDPPPQAAHEKNTRGQVWFKPKRSRVR